MLRCARTFIIASLLFCPLGTVSPAVSATPPAGTSGNGMPGVPSLAVLVERINSARGVLPPRDRLTIAYTYGGLTGRRVIQHDGKDSRTDNAYGPFSSASGVYHNQAWHQNKNGETVLDQPEPGNATRENVTTTVSHVTTPLDAYVIARLNAAGNGTKEYVDTTTFRRVRFERISPTGTTVTAYDDFRTVGGYTRAWHWIVRDSHPQDDADYRVTADDVGGAPPVLTVPDSRGEFVEFPAGKTSVALPVREERGKFIVRVQIGGRGLDLVLDTGASGIVLDDDVVRTLGLQQYGSITNAVNAGRYVTSEAVVPDMSVGDLRMHHVVVSTMPDFGPQGADYKAVGALGFDFIGAVALTFDYQNGRVTATKSDAFVPPTDPSTNTIPVRLGSQIPLADVRVNGALGERFLIDTGGGGTMLVFDYFARRHPEALTDALFLGGQPHFHGVGGAFDTQPYRVLAVQLGNITFKDFTIYRVTSSKSYSLAMDGTLGAGFLQLFTVYTDYANSSVYLVPNAAGRAARS